MALLLGFTEVNNSFIPALVVCTMWLTKALLIPQLLNSLKIYNNWLGQALISIGDSWRVMKYIEETDWFFLMIAALITTPGNMGIMASIGSIFCIIQIHVHRIFSWLCENIPTPLPSTLSAGREGTPSTQSYSKYRNTLCSAEWAWSRSHDISS